MIPLQAHCQPRSQALVCILQTIKNWRHRRPGNQATHCYIELSQSQQTDSTDILLRKLLSTGALVYPKNGSLPWLLRSVHESSLCRYISRRHPFSDHIVLLSYLLKCLHMKHSEETILRLHWGQGRLQCCKRCTAKWSCDMSQGMWVWLLAVVWLLCFVARLVRQLRLTQTFLPCGSLYHCSH